MCERSGPVSPGSKAFSRIELMALVAGTGLLCIPGWAALNQRDSASERAVCANNLRSISIAIQSVILESADNRTPWWVPVARGGTLGAPPEAFYPFSYLSNHLSGPRVFACPADSTAQNVFTWEEFRFGAKRSALSYTLSAHAGGDSPSALLAGDFNLRWDGTGTCVLSTVYPLNRVALSTNSILAWTNGSLHGESGNIVLIDGSVEYTSTERLREVVRRPEADILNDGYIHTFRTR
jgi:hypothetical protein